MASFHQEDILILCWGTKDSFYFAKKQKKNALHYNFKMIQKHRED